MIETVNETFIINNRDGMHARPSASFVKMASKFESNIFVEYNGDLVDGKSILELMTLAVGQGGKIKITAIGSDAQHAVQKLGKLVLDGFC